MQKIFPDLFLLQQHQAYTLVGQVNTNSQYLHMLFPHLYSHSIDIFPLKITDETIDEIFGSINYKSDEPIYADYGVPVGVKVIDPLSVPEGDFRLEILDTITPGDLSDAYWRLLYQPKGALGREARNGRTSLDGQMA